VFPPAHPPDDLKNALKSVKTTSKEVVIIDTPKKIQICTNKDIYCLNDEIILSVEMPDAGDVESKYVYFEKNNDYIFHLDNDIQDILEICDLTKVRGILYDCDWKENCLIMLKNKL
jgi:hypothetical protein